MVDRHLIWRATLRPAPGLPLRPITWDLQFRENEVAARADLDREGEMRDVDFREIPRRLNEVLLSEYLHPITQGEYALYQIRHHGEFAIASLRRTDNGPWEIDQIKGPKNSEPSERMREHFLQWHAVVNHELGA